MSLRSHVTPFFGLDEQVENFEETCLKRIAPFSMRAFAVFGVDKRGKTKSTRTRVIIGDMNGGRIRAAG